MRPVDRGTQPAGYAPNLAQLSLPSGDDITDYQKAGKFLADQLGLFCSYCERRIVTSLAVEHVLPKGLAQYKQLALSWDNFLLACVNCNSKKGVQDSDRSTHLWPDEHNTFRAYKYQENGLVEVISENLSIQSQQKAENVKSICGLNLNHSEHWETEDAKQAARERFGQRSRAIRCAKRSLARYVSEQSEELAEEIAEHAYDAGFFSIWMTTFEGYPEVRIGILAQYQGTMTGCFDENGVATPKVGADC